MLPHRQPVGSADMRRRAHHAVASARARARWQTRPKTGARRICQSGRSTSPGTTEAPTKLVARRRWIAGSSSAALQNRTMRSCGREPHRRRELSSTSRKTRPKFIKRRIKPKRAASEKTVK